MNNRLYVGNLAFETVEIQISDLFATAGTVSEANLMQDRMSGQSRGFAFVTMATAAEAQEAIRLLNGKDLNGRAITVTEARPREDKGGGGARR
ncbi:MAG: RNA-binding protein [Chthoniobacteraceae bacterium]